MNLFKNLPGLKSDDLTEVPLNDEEQAAADKQQRIQFHRENVRNGPAKFRPMSSGQIRRAEKRILDGRTRKARRAQIRAYFRDQREAATLRGHLQHAQALSFATPGALASPEQTMASVVWIVRHFAEGGDETGRVEVTYQVVIQSVQSALNRWQTLVGMPQTSLSPAYVLPVAVSAS